MSSISKVINDLAKFNCHDCIESLRVGIQFITRRGVEDSTEVSVGYRSGVHLYRVVQIILAQKQTEAVLLDCVHDEVPLVVVAYNPTLIVSLCDPTKEEKVPFKGITIEGCAE